MKLVTTSLFLVASALAGAGLARAGSDDEVSVSEVRRVVAEHASEIRACYEKHALRQRSSTGKVTLDLLIAPQGAVERTTVDAEGVRGRSFERCVTSRTAGWQFPQAEHGTEVQYPFLFQHTKI